MACPQHRQQAPERLRESLDLTSVSTATAGPHLQLVPPAVHHAPAPTAFLTQAALLNWLGQTPISFHRVYVDMTGNVITGLWLSHALAMAARAQPQAFDGDDFVFTMSARECEVATGITRAQQVNCRQSLVRLGLLSEEGGQRKTPTFRLHMNAVAQRMLHASEPLAQAIAVKTVSTPSAPMRLRD